MGIGSDIIGTLMMLKKEGYVPERSAVIEIGAQQLANSLIEAKSGLAELQKLYGVEHPYTKAEVKATDIVHGQLQHQHPDAPVARDFWKWLGFTYAAIDIDESEGSIPLDLNFDSIPALHIGKYNLVTNFGTTEHVANQLNAFKVIHELTAPNGIMMHHLPAQGMMNHGLFNYNPKFFWMLARSNGYRVVSADYSAADQYYELPQNVTDHVAAFDKSIIVRAKNYKMADSMIMYVMQKVYDIPFVPPIDVPTGTKTAHVALQERYWTIFKDNPFAGYPRCDSKRVRLWRYIKSRFCA